MHTITICEPSVTILRMLQCHYNVVAFSKTSTSWRSKPPTNLFYPYHCSVSSNHYPMHSVYCTYTICTFSAGRIRFPSFQLPSGCISWLKKCLVHLVRLAISADVATDWGMWRWSGNSGNIRILKWCTIASICCIDDLKARTKFLARLGFPTDVGYLVR